jgi:hypothetical protein
MKHERQEITRELLDDGSVEVNATPLMADGIRSTTVDDDGVRHVGYRTEEEIRATCNIDPSYELVALKANSWVQQDSDGPFIAHQAKATFRPPMPDALSAEAVYANMRQAGRRRPMLKNHRVKMDRGKRMLEISIADPHFGLACFAPGSDIDYNLETARRLYFESIVELVDLAKAYGGIDQILFVFGNDYLHAEPMASNKGIANATTSGTIQPDMLPWHHVYIFAEETVIDAIDMLTEVAPVEVVVVPGNHDRHSAFTLGRTIYNRFFHDENVTVQADPSPYKFKRWGVNLIGFEHGHSIPPVRMAGLMANERPRDWAETSFREWHLADQHRKGSGSPAVFEEQGVSVEFLPSIVAPNEWHRIKAFNNQKRGALAFLWDALTGPIARIGVNLLKSGRTDNAGGKL